MPTPSAGNAQSSTEAPASANDGPRKSAIATGCLSGSCRYFRSTNIMWLMTSSCG